MSRVRLSREAKLDLGEIWDYLGVAKDNPNAARRQIEMIYRKLALLATQPEMGERRDELRVGVRTFSAGRYVIYFVPMKNGIEVERIVHGSRDVGTLFQ